MRLIRRPTLGTDALFVAGLVLLAAQGCAQKQSAEQPVEHTVRKVTPETAAGSATAESNGKEEFERSLNMRLERLDETIREIQTKVANLTEAAKLEWAEKMADVTAKRKAAEEKLDEVRKSAADAWEHLREGADRAWEELEQAVQAARKEF